MVDNAPATASHAACLTADRATAQRLADCLSEFLDDQDVAATAFESADGRWTMAIYFSAPPNETAVRALVALAAGAELANALVFERIEAKDWVAASLRGLAPVEAGSFLVHGRHDRARVRGSRIGVEIEAALAFGTGHHGTTRGCLLALDEIVKRQRVHLCPRAGRGRPPKRSEGGRVRGRCRKLQMPPHPARNFIAHHPLSRSRIYPTSAHSLLLNSGKPEFSASGAREKRTRILDIGTGTGVLAIAAAKALKTRVLASDIDQAAVNVARNNARSNEAAPLVEFMHAAGLGAHRFRARGPFDLVLANILLGPLTRLARPMRRLLAPGARVVLSGLLTPQANAALAAYRAQGLALERRIVLGEWTTLVLRGPALPR